MSARDKFLNGGAYCRSAFVAINKTAAAGGAGDAAEVAGAYVDRKKKGGIALSAKLVIAYTATLAAGQTLTFAGNFEDDADGQGAGTDYGAPWAATVAATGASGGSTETGTFEIDVDLAGAKEFVRPMITPNLSAGATDTCEWSATLILFGDHRQPSTKAAATIGGADAIAI